MGFLSPSAPAAPPPPVPAPLPPRNITVGSTAIDRNKQRRRSSLANGAGSNRTLLSDTLSSGNVSLGV